MKYRDQSLKQEPKNDNQILSGVIDQNSEEKNVEIMKLIQALTENKEKNEMQICTLKDQLITNIKDLVWTCIYKYDLFMSQFEELYKSACIALVTAIEEITVDKEKSFSSSFAVDVILKHLEESRLAAKNEKQEKKPVQIADKVTSLARPTLTKKRIPTSYRVGTTDDVIKILEEKLSKAEYEILYQGRLNEFETVHQTNLLNRLQGPFMTYQFQKTRKDNLIRPLFINGNYPSKTLDITFLELESMNEYEKKSFLERNGRMCDNVMFLLTEDFDWEKDDHLVSLANEFTYQDIPGSNLMDAYQNIQMNSDYAQLRKKYPIHYCDIALLQTGGLSRVVLPALTIAIMYGLSVEEVRGITNQMIYDEYDIYRSLTINALAEKHSQITGMNGQNVMRKMQ